MIPDNNDGDLSDKKMDSQKLDHELLELLLEKFPFQSETEVYIVWNLFKDCMAVSKSSNDGTKDDDHDEKEENTKRSDKDLVTAIEENNNTHNTSKASYSKQELPVTVSSSLLRSWIVDHAMKMVYLPNIASSPHKEFFYFFEAVLSMIGRRSPIIELRLLHKFASLHQQLKTNHNQGMKKTLLPEAKDLVELSYDLAVSIHVILDSQGRNHDQSSSSLDNKINAPVSPPKSLINSLDEYNKQNNINYENDNKGISFNIFRQWVECKVPNIMNILSTFFRLTIMGPTSLCYDNMSSNNTNNRHIFTFPQFFMTSNESNTITENDGMITTTSSELFKHQCDSNLFSIICMEPRLSAKWLRLYTNTVDGCSFFSLQKSIAGYNGPTILILRPIQEDQEDNTDSSSGGGMFGFFTMEGWKESRTYHGSSDCFLFRLDQSSLDVYRPKCLMSEGPDSSSTYNNGLYPTKKGLPTENFMFMSPSSFVGNNSNLFTIHQTIKYGLAVGGTLKNPRLCLSETLEGCIASRGGTYDDNTFVEGPLLPSSSSKNCEQDDGYYNYNKYFNVDIIEIWGIDTNNDNFQYALNSRNNVSEQMDATKRKVQQIRDKSVFLQDFQSGVYMNSLFQHRDASSHNHDNDD